MSEIRTHYRNCNICEVMCGLEIKYQDKEILSIKGDLKDPFSKGYSCPKASALEDFYTDKEGLKTPIRRIAKGWEDISWDEAFTEIADKLKGGQNTFGKKNALAAYLSNPNAHNLGNTLFLKPFMKRLGTINRFSSPATNQMPHHVASNFMFGAGMLIFVPNIDRTNFMLIIGGNPVVSIGSMMTAPNVIGLMNAIQKRGGKIVVVDPRRTRTAKIAVQHLFIRPEKGALLFAMIHCIFASNSVNLRHLENMVDGLEGLERIAKDYALVPVAEHVGIEAIAIRTLTADMVSANSPVCYSRMGASTQTFGGLCQWLTNVLNIITDNFDRAGVAMSPQPAFDLLRNHKRGHKISFGQYQTRVRKLPFFNGEFSVATLAEEIQTPGEGQLRSLISVAGNPVLSSPSGHKLAEAFEGFDYMVSVDIYLNETTKYASIILPGTTGIENSHFDIFFNRLSVRNTVKYLAPLFEKEDYQRSNYQILKALAA